MCAHERSFLSAYHRSRYIHAPVLPPAASAPAPGAAFTPGAAPVPVSALAPASVFAPGAAFVAVLVPARIPLLFQPALPPIPAPILMLRACSYSAIFHKFVLSFFSFCTVLPLL